ncbi:P22 phage major capsid protein family protein [Curtobacterium sp. MCBD17_003]|uniref:P22 phage major capsid protein family protein n=1 Tax=Curtobacterium sp. MCBD17_003 TaxID=2175667 RepID=UPI0015E8DBDF|nr:P22 phage major capsid protein family protein [Curtobacterium sp. MCBD17_003]WIE54224.1 P22 phage major capsid protein family protein [Curtobacterium sp. MCBD17_003]
MANTLYTPVQAARATLASLRWLSLLPRTVRQDFNADFVAGVGQTVNVLGPVSAGKAKVYTKANRTNRDAIQFNELGQQWYPVQLNDQVYNAVRLPDDFETFTLKDMTQQVLIPQAESVVDELATPLVAQMTAIATDEAIPAVAPDGSNFRSALIHARGVLNKRKVPAVGRTFAVGADMEAAALEDELLQRVNESGTSDVLRNATIGNLFGFTIVADPSLPDDFGIGYHRDAFAHVTRPSKQPQGAAYSATVAQDGFALRWIQHYNPLQLEDQSVVDTFYGAATLDPLRAVSATMAS